MCRFLMDLSVELHLMIVDELLIHDTNLFHESIRSGDDDEDDFVQHRDLMSWSCTARYFRHLLAPFIFSKVRLRLDERSGKSIEQLLHGPHRTQVHSLYVVGPTPLDYIKLHHAAIESGEVDRDKEGIVAGDGSDKARDKSSSQLKSQLEIQSTSRGAAALAIVKKLLCNLGEFTKLGVFSIDIPYPFDYSCLSRYDELYQRHYNKEYTLTDHDQSEAWILKLRRSWRAWMTQIYSIVSEDFIEKVCEDKELPFSILEVRKFPWHFTDPFKQGDFQVLLSHLDGLAVTVGGYGETETDTSRLEEQLDCLADLCSLFFEHLDCATGLKLVASSYRPIGLMGLGYATLPLYPGTANNLSYLYLEEIFICNDIVEFLKSLHDTFEHLVLQDCYCSINDENLLEDGFYWKDFFNGLYEACLPKFTRLQIRPLRPRMIWSDEDGLMLRLEMPDVRKILETNKKRHVFPYINLEPDTVIDPVQFDEETSIDQFLRGEDQVAYTRLRQKLTRQGGDHV